jgi:hypothetical protein
LLLIERRYLHHVAEKTAISDLSESVRRLLEDGPAIKEKGATAIAVTP